MNHHLDRLDYWDGKSLRRIMGGTVTNFNVGINPSLKVAELISALVKYSIVNVILLIN
jgi:hypothetical protein